MPFKRFTYIYLVLPSVAQSIILVKREEETLILRCILYIQYHSATVRDNSDDDDDVDATRDYNGYYAFVSWAWGEKLVNSVLVAPG